MFADDHLSNVYVRACVLFSFAVVVSLQLLLSVHHNLQATQKQFAETTNKLRVGDVVVVADAVAFSLVNKHRSVYKFVNMNPR